MLFILSGFAFGWIKTFTEVNWKEQNGIVRDFRIFWLSGSAIVWLLWLFVVYYLVRPARPEAVKLSTHRFQYDPGRLPFAYPFLIYDPPWLSLPDPLRHRRKRLDIPKSEMAELILDRFGGRQRLYFQSDSLPVEIGEHLREPDREWLAAVIRSWRAS